MGRFLFIQLAAAVAAGYIAQTKGRDWIIWAMPCDYNPLRRYTVRNKLLLDSFSTPLGKTQIVIHVSDLIGVSIEIYTVDVIIGVAVHVVCDPLLA